MYAYLNGQFVPYDQTYIHVSDLAVQRGFGVFDFFKIQQGIPFFLDDYLDRFNNSAAALNLNVPLKRNELIDVIRKLIVDNRMDESGMKMILTGGYSDDGYQPSKPNFIITQQTLTMPPTSLLETGVKVITHEHVREIPSAKTINYTMGIWLIGKVNAANAYDVLYVKDGIVSEFPRSNFFVVQDDDTVVTPLRNVLLGVTRRNILKVAQQCYNVQERDLTLHEVFNAKEAFITSTTKRIIPVVNIDGKLVGSGAPGKVTRDLYNRLLAFEDAFSAARL